MSMHRRRFLHFAGAAAGLIACRPGAAPQTAAPAEPAEPAAPPLRSEPILLGGQAQKILILGGTGFLGPHLVEAARRRGHTVTIFTRGKTRPDLFGEEVEKLRGDRDGDLKSLEGRRWDSVIDTSGYVPRIVRASAELLAPNVRQYVFISSISAYADTSKPGIDETYPVAVAPDPKSEDVPQFYGALKALCEQAVEAALPGRATTIRPGLIVGPGDPTDRFTYWPVRIAAGGEVLAPGDPKVPVQVIDARDLAEFTIELVERGSPGIYNAVGPREPITVGDMLTRTKAALGSDAELTWVSREFLAEKKVEPWSDLPAWAPPDPGFEGFGAVSGEKSFAAGLTTRPLEETVTATIAWWNALPAERRAKPRAGLTREREAEVLAAWHALHPAPGKTPGKTPGKAKPKKPKEQKQTAAAG